RIPVLFSGFVFCLFFGFLFCWCPLFSFSWFGFPVCCLFLGFLFLGFRFLLFRSNRSREFSSITSTEDFLSSTKFLAKSSKAGFMLPSFELEINCLTCSKLNLYQVNPPSR